MPIITRSSPRSIPAPMVPRSLSIFAVPHSSTRNWQRLETHVLRSMVLTKFDIDGPGILIGQVGRGLEILQRMALPSKYHCAYMGVKMVDDSLPAAIEHLSSKNIFGSNPIAFSNVFRQLYNLVQQAALINFSFLPRPGFQRQPFSAISRHHAEVLAAAEMQRGLVAEPAGDGQQRFPEAIEYRRQRDRQFSCIPSSMGITR